MGTVVMSGTSYYFTTHHVVPDIVTSGVVRSVVLVEYSCQLLLGCPQ